MQAGSGEEAVSATVFKDMYERLFQITKADATIVPSLVPEANIWPDSHR